jgi:hypothetical protein
VVILALIVPALILFATFKFCRPLILVIVASAELNVPALTVPVVVRLPALILPATFKSCNPLIVVMFASAELNVPALTMFRCSEIYLY